MGGSCPSGLGRFLAGCMQSREYREDLVWVRALLEGNRESVEMWKSGEGGGMRKLRRLRRVSSYMGRRQTTLAPSFAIGGKSTPSSIIVREGTTLSFRRASSSLDLPRRLIHPLCK